VKRAIRALDPENPDPDLTNMERFRPEGGRADGTTTFMPGATIPGFLAMTPAAKANWPLGEPTVETPLKAARARERAPTSTPRAERPKRPISPAQRAHIDRLNAQRKAAREMAPAPEAP
jgi:hypothetical protein